MSIFVPLLSTHVNIEKKLVNSTQTSVSKGVDLAPDDNDLDGVVVIPETISTLLPEGLKQGHVDSKTNPNSFLLNSNP